MFVPIPIFKCAFYILQRNYPAKQKLLAVYSIWNYVSIAFNCVRYSYHTVRRSEQWLSLMVYHGLHYADPI
jgi:hypothetical protein